MATKKQTKQETKNQVNNPIMKQFNDLKKKHPDALLLFRCGDFYEAYGEDARVCSELLGIAFTKGEPDMCGFPFHALDTYLPRIVRAGKQVAICDQLEAPKPKAEDAKPAPKAKLKKQTYTYTFDTYQNKHGKTCARIAGFKADDDVYKNAKEYHASPTTVHDKDGGKVNVLLFGPVYLEAARQLCDALNGKSKKAVKSAKEAFEGALSSHRQQRSEQRAEFAKKNAERKAKKAEKKQTKKERVYTESELKEMFTRYANGETVAEIDALIGKVA